MADQSIASLAMSPLSVEPDNQWRWSQVQTDRRTYALRSSANLLGGLRFESAWGSLATADSVGHRWTFKRVGFFNTRVTVREPNRTDNVAVFTPSWTGGSLRMGHGVVFEWRATGMWSFEHGWFRSDGAEVLRVRPSSLSKVEADVVVAPLARGVQELELLSLLSFYLLLLAAEDAAATTSVVTSG